MSAKVDSALIQDGFQIYHHTFFFSKNGAWTVVQQGMNEQTQKARRYHWHSQDVADMVIEPHTAIVSAPLGLHQLTLNMTARKSEQNQKLSVELVQAGYRVTMKEVQLLRKYATPLSQMAALRAGDEQLVLLNLEDKEFKTHPVVRENFAKSKYLEKILWLLTERKPKNYEELLATEGVGPKTIRALALVGEVIYGAPPSYQDPARYSFAHGGKDATPYPIERATYDATIAALTKAIRRTKIPLSEKKETLARLQGV